MLCLFTGAYFAPARTADVLNTQNVTQVDCKEDVFVLKSENNRLVVRKNGEKLPYMTTDTIVSSLPKGDIMLLEKGIEVRGEENLRKYLEDYCS